MMKLRLMIIGFCGLFLTACGGGVDEIIAEQCPEIAVLASADRIDIDGVTAQMNTARLSCFVDSDSDQLLADIRLKGKASASGVELPFFVATLDKDNRITERLQYKVNVSNRDFSFDLPRYAYATRLTLANRPRLVAGFVLSQEQLDANRSAYRQRLGIE